MNLLATWKSIAWIAKQDILRTHYFFTIFFMVITIHAPKFTAFNPFQFSKFKYLQAVQFVFTMYQKLCKTNVSRVSRTLYVLFSVHDSTVEWEEKQIIHEKIEHCIIWVVIDIPHWQFIDSAYPFLKFAVVVILSFFVFSARYFWKYPQDSLIHVHNILPWPTINNDKSRLIIMPR